MTAANTETLQGAPDSLLPPYTRAWEITPNDSADLVRVPLCVTARVSGNLAYVPAGNADGDVVPIYVEAGGVYRFAIKRIMATGTSAQGIVGHYK